MIEIRKFTFHNLCKKDHYPLKQSLTDNDKYFRYFVRGLTLAKIKRQDQILYQIQFKGGFKSMHQKTVRQLHFTNQILFRQDNVALCFCVVSQNPTSKSNGIHCLQWIRLCTPRKALQILTVMNDAYVLKSVNRTFSPSVY